MFTPEQRVAEMNEVMSRHHANYVAWTNGEQGANENQARLYLSAKRERDAWKKIDEEGTWK